MTTVPTSEKRETSALLVKVPTTPPGGIGSPRGAKLSG